MFINYKNKNFCGFDDIKHQSLYKRHTNLKKIKDELLKRNYYVKNSSVYNKVFDKYDFYRNVNYKIYGLIEMYKKENLLNNVELLSKKYNQKLENIILSGRNNSKIQISIRIVWDLIFLKEYIIFGIVIIKNKFINEFRKRNRINQKGL